MPKHRRQNIIRVVNQESIPALVDEFLVSKRAEGRAPTTIQDYAVKLGKWQYWLSTAPVRPVDPFSVEAVREYSLYLLEAEERWDSEKLHAKKPLCRESVRAYLRPLRALCSWLADPDQGDEIERSPFESFKLPKAEKHQIKPFSQEQCRAMIDVCRRDPVLGERNLAVVLVLLDTGLRVSELCALVLENWEGNRLHVVRGKGAKERFVFISPATQRALSRYVRRCRPETEYSEIFLSEHGMPFTRNGVYQLIDRIGEAAGVEGVRCSPHTFRHTAAIEAVRGGMDVFTLQAMLGHESLEMCRRYVQIAREDIERAHEKASPVSRLGIRFRDKEGRG